uniref:Uncharacterized protein n=1 Tax=Ditylum brightwellii TaxID=49249 RepID=A0A7S4VWZ4_9STRA
MDYFLSTLDMDTTTIAMTTIPQWIHPYILRFALLLFETVAPCTILVSSVIRYAIWPKILASAKNHPSTKPNPTKDLKLLSTLFQHNANVILAFMEVGLLGGLPIRFCDVPLGPLYASCYVLFSWCMMKQWKTDTGTKDAVTGDVIYGKCRCPQFLYFFLDTTLGDDTSTISLGVLALVQVLSYVFFGLANQFFRWFISFIVVNEKDGNVVGGGGIIEKGTALEVLVRFVMVMGTCSLFCRFRD